MADYEYYDTDYCIPEEDFLQNNRQFKLTIRTSYKLLETGTQVYEDGEEVKIFKLFILPKFYVFFKLRYWSIYDIYVYENAQSDSEEIT